MADYSVIGGDMRAVYLARQLRASGFDVATFALSNEEEGVSLENAAKAEFVILPMPFAKNGLLNAPFADNSIDIAAVAAAVGSRRVLGGGNGRGLFASYTDYAEDEGYILKNADITAEGAAGRYSALSGRTVRGSRIAVVGFGRVARSAARLFAAMGADITIVARSEPAVEQARSMGYKAAYMGGMCCVLSESDGVVNTVPAPVITAAEILCLPENAVIIDLASSPGGVDFAAAFARGIRAELSLALPGRTAPYSAAEALCEVILKLTRGKEAWE